MHSILLLYMLVLCRFNLFAITHALPQMTIPRHSYDLLKMFSVTERRLAPKTAEHRVFVGRVNERATVSRRGQEVVKARS